MQSSSLVKQTLHALPDSSNYLSPSPNEDDFNQFYDEFGPRLGDFDHHLRDT
jgi:hypothetical protein